MSELKAGVLVTPHNEGMCFHRSSVVIAVTEGETEFYDKSEADKVIAHNKYKRCLAMWLYLRECYWRCKHHNEKTRADWYEKWMDNFQKLAEKFKEAK